MSSQFQIVFNGQLLDGFELAAVKASAVRRLKAAPEQIERLFSGKRAVLKKGLTDEIARRYATELQRIGMRVAIETELAPPAPVVSSIPAQDAIDPDPIGAIDSLPVTPIQQRNQPQRVTSRDEPAFDPMKTQISSIADELQPPPPERWSQPTIAISQKHLNALQTTEAASASSSAAAEPTLIVPRASSASEPTIVVTRGSASNARGLSARDSAASEPTMIVPPRQGLSSAPTPILPSRHSDASEPTLIVPPRQSAAAQPTIIVRSNQKLAPTDRGNAEPGFDPEKTMLSSNAAIEAYLSPEPEPAPVPSSPKASVRPVTPEDPSPAVISEEVQCPTCGDKQPKRVYCRRCGHALALPPPMPAMGESTITKKSPPRPPAPQKNNDLTVLVEKHDEPIKKNASKRDYLAAPTWFAIGLMFLVLLAVAGWLLFT
jgi:hypothetical protein